MLNWYRLCFIVSLKHRAYSVLSKENILLASLMLLIGWQEWHPTCKKILSGGCWRGFLSTACADCLHVSQLMPLPLTVSCFSKIQIGFTFLVPAHPCNPWQRAVKRVCVCLCYSRYTATNLLNEAKAWFTSWVICYYYYYYAAFNAPCVGHKDYESQAKSLISHSRFGSSASRGLVYIVIYGAITQMSSL